MPKCPKGFSRSGFTLIELLIVISIIAIMTSIGIVSYNNFAQAQTLKNGALDFQSNLRFAQNQSLSGQKDVSLCGDPTIVGSTLHDLVGWYITPTISSTSYSMSLRCVGVSAKLEKSFNLPAGITFQSISSGSDILFKPLAGATITSNANTDSPVPTGAALTDIIITNGTDRYKITVSSGGEIYVVKI